MTYACFYWQAFLFAMEVHVSHPIESHQGMPMQWAMERSYHGLPVKFISVVGASVMT